MSQEEDIKNFPYPLNKEIDEEIPVKKVSVDSIDEKTGKAKFSVKTVLEKQKVKYLHVPKKKMRCKDGEHIFKPFNIKRGLFSCTKCPFVRKVYPSTHKFEDGKLIHRVTGKAV